MRMSRPASHSLVSWGHLRRRDLEEFLLRTLWVVASTFTTHASWIYSQLFFRSRLAKHQWRQLPQAPHPWSLRFLSETVLASLCLASDDLGVLESGWSSIATRQSMEFHLLRYRSMRFSNNWGLSHSSVYLPRNTINYLSHRSRIRLRRPGRTSTSHHQHPPSWHPCPGCRCVSCSQIFVEGWWYRP